MASSQKRSSTKFHVDIDELIREVHYRPAIWNKNCLAYADRRLRARSWDKVCENIISNWKELKKLQQNSISTEVQKKWRNVKDAFKKEVKRLAAGRENVRKRQYCHFKALSFLNNQEAYTSIRAVSIDGSDEESDNTSEEQDNTSANSSRKRSRNKNEDENESMIPVKREKIPIDEESSNGENNTRKTDKTQDSFLEIELENIDCENADAEKSQNDDYTDRNFVEINCDDWDITSNQITSKKDSDKDPGVKVYDEDISFTEMMIPMLRRLNDEQKHFAKIEILNILHNATRYQPSSSCETQTDHDN